MPAPTRSFLFTMAFAIGVMAANIYYTQPILSLLATDLGLRPDAAGLIMTVTQIGYGLGVLFFVPLGDLVENKKLILSIIALAIIAELTIGTSKSTILFLAASLVAGLGASAVQIIVPYVTHLYDPKERGRVIGSLMSGLMLGIMFSRPLASLLADMVSHHAVFFVSAAAMAVLFWRLAATIPQRRPQTNLSYGQLIWSMKQLLFNTPTLRRRATYQALMFGAFCLFWTVVPLYLQTQYQFTQKGIALFALAGVAGAIAAPFAGRMADRGLGRRATLYALASGVVAFLLSHVIFPDTALSLIVLLIAANLLDAGVSAHLVLGQRAIFMIDPRNQSRLNGLYIAMLYVGGAVGSALGAWAYTHGGWETATWIGALFPLLALGLFASEKTFGYVEA